MTVTIINDDVFEGLSKLADESVHCCVTSPPYWSARQYLPDDAPEARHEIGREVTLREHIDKLVAVFREVRRALRSDGVCFVNYGDMFCQTDKWGGGKNGNSGKHTVSKDGTVPAWTVRQRKPHQDGIKPKDLMLIPERLAIALCDDGWYVRSRIIWHKLNPLPESVTDRPTKSHEHIWMLTKSPRYYWDADAIKERAEYAGPNSPASQASPYGQGFTRRAKAINAAANPPGTATHKGLHKHTKNEAAGEVGLYRNCRDVWTISTVPFADAHFATYPPELVERCIKAGSPVGGVVLDPFFGAGTTGLVADRLQRDCIGIELNPAYVEMAERRLQKDRGALLDIMETPEPPLFSEAAS